MKVSVIIPNYNHSSFLKRRIESVLEQTYTDFEVIILDDCSTDNSREIIEQYRNHPRISQIVFNEQNSGSTFAQWNKGLSLATGEYIWIAESDDVASPMLLSTLVSGIITDSNVAIAYCQSYKMDEHENVNGSWLTYTATLPAGEIFEQNFVMNGNEFIKKFLLDRNVIPNASAVLTKKDLFLSVGGADAGVKYNADWLAWLKILTEHKVYFCPQELNYFRYHQKSVISNAIKTGGFLKKYDIIMKKKYREFLQQKGNKDLLRASKLALRKDIADEAYYFFHNKQYIKALPFYFKKYFRLI